MVEYYDEFRKIKFQIYDIGYIDRVERFTGNLSERLSEEEQR